MKDIQEVHDIIVKDKEEILSLIKESVMDFLEEENILQHHNKTFNRFVLGKIRDCLFDNFSLQLNDVYSIDEDTVEFLVEDYFFDKKNYKE